METLELLAVALGLATLAGLNLYLTVFATGLAVHFQWVTLAEAHSHLAVLGDPWIVGISGALYFLQFFADKVPWVDSLNDTVHTAIRPLGGAVLAVLALGDAHPAVSVIAALLSGGAALTSHAAKAGTRLVANASPEPISNIGLSLGEDAVVLGGLTLVWLYPFAAAAIALIALVLIWMFLPGLLRATRATAWLAWRKLNTPAAPDASRKAPPLPANCEAALRRARATSSDISETVPCISGGGPRLPKHYRGWLVRFACEPDNLFFVAPRWRGPLVVDVPVANSQPKRSSKFLSEMLELGQPGGERHRFLFERGEARQADRLAESLNRENSEASLAAV